MRIRNVDKQQLVKQKTMEMLVADGFEGFSVNKLAKACGISVATLYIYYRDKEDLIVQIAIEEGQKMSDTVLKGFHAGLSFEEGLRMQWRNRSRYMLSNPAAIVFFDQLRNSSYEAKIFDAIAGRFKDAMGQFMLNAINRGEIRPMPLEVYWSVAFAPLYNLLRFHNSGRSISGQKFVLKEKMLWETFELVLKAFKN